MSSKTKPTTIDEYIANAPQVAQEKLQELRALLKEVAPDAKEDVKWGSPVFVGKRILFSFSAHKSHINFMPTRTSLTPFEKELENFKTGQDTIQLPYDQPLPRALLKKIASYRVKEVAEGSLWMHNDSEQKQK